MHATDGLIELLQPPGHAFVFADADGCGVMAAIPLLAGARNAPENRQQPGAIRAHDDRRADKASAWQIEKPAFRRRQVRCIFRVRLDLCHSDPAFVLVSRRLRGVEQKQPTVGSLKQHGVLFGMGWVETQALRRPPGGCSLHENGGIDRDVRLTLQGPPEPGADEAAIGARMQKGGVVLHHG